MKIQFKKLKEGGQKPFKKNEGDAGYDLCSCENYLIEPMTRKLISTGISLQIPEGFYAHVSDRSGLALNNGAHCLGKIIDSTYRGEIGVIIYNTDMYTPIKIKVGQRIAQIIIKKYENVDFEEAELENSERGEQGFGSSGL